jgi:hypothetical protein
LDGDWSSPVSGGLLCGVGRFEPLAERRERVLTPLVRRAWRVDARELGGRADGGGRWSARRGRVRLTAAAR